jgi:hypothetical protein
MSLATRRLICTSGFVSLMALIATGCQSNPGSPVSPSALGAASPRTLDRSSSVSVLGGSSGGNGLPLIEVAGSSPAGGGGTANTVPTASPDKDVIEATINVHGAPSDADLYFQIRSDRNLSLDKRGNYVCDEVERVGFPDPPFNFGVIHTSSGGAGSVHVRFEIPDGTSNGAFEPGAKVDQMFRVVNLTKTFELRTDCMTLLMK